MSIIIKYPYGLIRPLYERTSFHRSVIDEMNNDSLKSAYTHCRAITRYYAKTFYMATRFLPNDKQRGIFAIYGYCRYIDNLVDDNVDLINSRFVPNEQLTGKLDELRFKIADIYEGKIQFKDPIFTAFADTFLHYEIPEELPLMLIDGVEQDLHKNRYLNFKEIYDYSFKVASVVGLMTTPVFGYKDEQALNYATDLGIAMQLTNILRDVGEDVDRDRIYLAQDELVAFGLTDDDILRKQMDDRFIEFMKYQIRRAREYYERAEKGISMLDRNARLPVYLARYNYAKILDKIEENNYDVFSSRAHLTKLEKLSILPQILYKINIAS
ncbi:MAG: squalene synthase [Balneola sp.]|nr:squalene synthase [Balneola sp.]